MKLSKIEYKEKPISQVKAQRINLSDYSQKTQEDFNMIHYDYMGEYVPGWKRHIELRMPNKLEFITETIVCRTKAKYWKSIKEMMFKYFQKDDNSISFLENPVDDIDPYYDESDYELDHVILRIPINNLDEFLMETIEFTKMKIKKLGGDGYFYDFLPAHLIMLSNMYESLINHFPERTTEFFLQLDSITATIEIDIEDPKDFYDEALNWNQIVEKMKKDNQTKG